jgi:hypothetical protein
VRAGRGPAPATHCLRLRLAQRVVLCITAAALTAFAAGLVLWQGRDGGWPLLAVVSWLLMLAGLLLMPVWRQRLEWTATTVRHVPGHGAARTLNLADLRCVQTRWVGRGDPTGREYLELFDHSRGTRPWLSISLQSFARRDRDRLLKWAAALAERGVSVTILAR